MKKTLMITGLLIAIALVVATAFVQFNRPALAQGVAGDGDMAPLEIEGDIHVTGYAKASVAPDMAVLRLGVEAMSTSSVTQAHSRANAAMNAMIIALAGSGVDTTTDVQTTRFSIYPDYDWTDEGRKMIGYIATQDISVRIRDLDSVGVVIDGAIMAGGNDARFHALDFVASDNPDLMRQLREDAYNDALAQAEHLAELAGMEVAGAASISTGYASPLPTPYFAEAALAQQLDTLISPGQVDLSMSIQVTFLTVAADISATPVPEN